jgi:hypothetical protein
METKKLRALRL